ncbi:MAG: Flp family type IVb pilin [Nocardioides sp.]
MSTRDDRGASAIEYGLLIAGIAALIVLIPIAFSGTITGLFDETCESIEAEASNATC